MPKEAKEKFPDWRRWLREDAAKEKKAANKPSRIVGTFKMHGFTFAWVVSGFRSDKRIGPIGQVPISPYNQELYDAMMRKWR